MEYIGNINYDKTLESDQMFVIYGAGHFGRKVAEFLKKKDRRRNIACFCDKNEKLWGTKIESIEIMSIDTALEKYPQAHFIVAGVYAKEMVEELQKYNVKNIHLLFLQ